VKSTITICLVVVAIFTVGCGQKGSSSSSLVKPAAPVANDAATASLNYWNGLNSLPNQIAADMQGGPKDQVRALRGAANVIRRQPVLGVDPDLTDWAHRMATSLLERADLMEQARDPSRLADAFLRGARGNPLGPAIELNQTERAWLTNFRNLTREQGQLRARLTTRYGIEFPPP
jgi:hypothetical protein